MARAAPTNNSHRVENIFFMKVADDRLERTKKLTSYRYRGFLDFLTGFIQGEVLERKEKVFRLWNFFPFVVWAKGAARAF